MIRCGIDGRQQLAALVLRRFGRFLQLSCIAFKMMTNRFLSLLAVATLLVIVLVLGTFSRDDYATQIGRHWRPPTVEKQDAVPEAMHDEVADGIVQLMTHQAPPEKGVVTAKLESQDTSWLEGLEGQVLRCSH